MNIAKSIILNQLFLFLLFKPKYKEIILEEIEKNLKEGPAYYDVEEYTDQTLKAIGRRNNKRKKHLNCYKMKYHMEFLWKLKKWN